MERLKIAAACPALKVGDCNFNADRIVEAIARLDNQGTDAVVFPELSLTSLSCGDLFAYDALLEATISALQRVAESTKNRHIVAVIGLPFRYEKGIYDCAAVVRDGIVQAILPKRSGKERRGVSFHFADGDGIVDCFELFSERVMFLSDYSFEIKGHAVTVAVGNDIKAWIYKDCVVLNPNCDIEIVGYKEKRKELLCGVSAAGCAVVSAFPSATESTTDYVFSSHCLAARNGEKIGESKPFEEGVLIAEIEPQYQPKNFIPKTGIDRYRARHPFLAAPEEPWYYNDILDIQAHGLKKRVEHIDAKKVLLGISGGLDSALALFVACRAMDIMGRPRSDVIAISMPAFGTTGRTKNNAEHISKLLGVDYRMTDITKAVEQHFSDIGHSGSTADAAFENAQARERTQILMDLANMTGGIQIGTGDLSELALGFATYGGDQMSMYSVNGSIPKTLVKALVAYCGDEMGGELKEVCYDICDTPISPELQPVKDGEQHQKTEEIVGPYELHDFFIWHMFVHRESPKQILAVAKEVFAGVYDGATIKKLMREFFRRFFSQQFKRSCMPDGPMATEVSFSPRGGLAMPSDMAAAAWLDEVDLIEV